MAAMGMPTTRAVTIQAEGAAAAASSEEWVVVAAATTVRRRAVAGVDRPGQKAALSQRRRVRLVTDRVSLAFDVPKPTITQITPSDGPSAGGTTITISGVNLWGATAVTLGGIAASDVVVVNQSTVTTVTPAGAGLVDVSVTTGSGTATLASAYNYVDLTFRIFEPSAGVTSGGTSVTLSGTGLAAVAWINFAGKIDVNDSRSDTSLVFTSPPGTGVATILVQVGWSLEAIPTGFTFTYYTACGATGVVCQPIDQAVNAGQLSLSSPPPNASGTEELTCPAISLGAVTLDGTTHTSRASARTIYVGDDRGTRASGGRSPPPWCRHRPTPTPPVRSPPTFATRVSAITPVTATGKSQRRTCRLEPPRVHGEGAVEPRP